ncbi:MAG TPA: hypothetical protein VHU44_07565 [Acidobacteriaceae bacterium]|jgi:hypothetical protein|nr:hypothetical protein [Acidobacteriaceae bacterium]
MTQSSETRHDFDLNPLEYDVLCAVVTKFAADLVLFRLAKPNPSGEAAALEEVATSTALMLNERRVAEPVEILALHAIVESISTGASDDFFAALSVDHVVPLTAARLKRIVRVIHYKLSSSGLREAA